MFTEILTFRILKVTTQKNCCFFISACRSCLSIIKCVCYKNGFDLKQIKKFQNNKKFLGTAWRLKRAFVMCKFMNTFIAGFYFFFVCELWFGKYATVL